MKTDFLERILEEKRADTARLPSSTAYSRADYRLCDRRDFECALRQPGISVIAEFKRRSPSKGELAPELDPSALAMSYEVGGAAAISCLTDSRFFGARRDDLIRCRDASTLPILRKDFIIDERQVHESAAMGADAILLIARVLTAQALEGLIETAIALELSVLVEVHDTAEVSRAAGAGATVIGVNNRDLATFEVNLDNAIRLRDEIPDHCISVAESGIRTIEDVRRMASAGYDAVLVGESLVCHDNPANAVRSLLGAGAAIPGGVR